MSRSPTTAGSSPAPTGPLRARERVGFAGIALAMVLVIFDVSATDASLTSIQGDLDVTLAGTELIAVVPLVAAGSLMILMGDLGDRIGFRRLMLIALGCYTLAAVGAAAAPVLLLLLVCRALTGVALAAMLPGVYALTDARLPSGHSRAGAFAAVTAAFGIGLALGPVVGGAAASAGMWRWVYVMEGVLALVALLAIRTSWSLSVGAAGTGIDVIGAPLLAGGLAALLLAVSPTGRSGAWSPAVWVAAAALLATFGHRERTRSTAGHSVIIPGDLFRDGHFRWGALTAALMSAGYFGAVLILPQTARTVWGYSPWVAGAIVFPLGAGMLLGGVLAARERVLAHMVTGVTVQVIAILGMVASLWSGGGSAGAVVAACLFGYGTAWGLTFSWVTSAMTQHLPRDTVGVAAGIQTALRWIVAALVSGGLAAILASPAMTTSTSPLVAAMVTTFVCAAAIPCAVMLGRGRSPSIGV